MEDRMMTSTMTSDDLERSR